MRLFPFLPNGLAPKIESSPGTNSHHDIVIVGAGAAGIAAGRRLRELRRSFLILEASERVGGRAWTRVVDNMALDLGCGWLHSAERNPWAQLAQEQGVAIDRTAPAWGEQFEQLGFPREEQRAAKAEWDAFERRLRDAPPASDRAADALDPASPWNAYLDAHSGYINGAGLHALSVADYRAYEDADTGVNWRLPGGYGALVAAAAAGLPIASGAAVTRIDRTGPVLALETPQGRLTAGQAIVAVPTSVLAEGRLRFDPSLDDKAEAARHLPLGLANKLFLHLDEPRAFPPEAHLLGNPQSAATGSYYLRPFGRPLVEVFFGGDHARELERAGTAATVDFAVEELVALLGSGFRRRLSLAALSAWGEAPFVSGAYSHALPGHADARAALRAPVEGRIFFCGEACSACDFSTAHGAYATGIGAAEAALAAS